MLRNLVYLILVCCFTASLSFSQNNSEQISTQTDRQKAAIVVPSATLPNQISLLEGKVVFVYDGDTISIETKDRKVYSIRLQGIDAPENKQDYSKKSRKNLEDLIEGKEVRAVLHKKDLYDRYIGTIYLDGQDINLQQIEAGMAWHYKPYGFEQTAEERKKYAQAELKARSAQIGLWEDRNPMPPWDYRNSSTTTEPNQKDKKESVTNSNEPPAKTDPSGRTYIRGPRGGCYYVNASGKKVYMKDKSLCDKQ